MKILKPLFWCFAFYYANNLRIVHAKHLLYHIDRVCQVKFHDHSNQMPLISFRTQIEVSKTSCDHKVSLTRKRKSRTDANYWTTCLWIIVILKWGMK